MTRTTPPRPLDLVRLFPGLDAFARTATRLHPRPGATDARASHVGGPLLWPADEPWPACAAPHQVREERLLSPELVILAGSGDSAALEELRRQAGGARMVKETDAGVFAVVETTVTEPVPPAVQLRWPGGERWGSRWTPHRHRRSHPRRGTSRGRASSTRSR